MQDEHKADEDKQETKPPGRSVGQPTRAAPERPSPQADNGKPKDDPEPSEPILVRLIAESILKPFEEQSLVIARENLDISRRTYRIAVFGFLAALAAAIFVGVQVREISYQTQIMGAQSESAAAAAANGEMNTRRQLDLAEKQTRAAQGSVEAIQTQMRVEQRPLLKLTFDLDQLKPRAPLTGVAHIINGGRTPAREISAEFVIKIFKNGRPPKLSYNLPHTVSSTGTLFPSERERTIPVERILPVIKGMPPQVDILTQAEYDDFMGARAFVAIYGIVSYEDIFKVRHWTKQCIPFVSPVTPGYSDSYKCANYGDIDSN